MTPRLWGYPTPTPSTEPKRPHLGILVVGTLRLDVTSVQLAGGGFAVDAETELTEDTKLPRGCPIALYGADGRLIAATPKSNFRGSSGVMRDTLTIHWTFIVDGQTL